MDQAHVRPAAARLITIQGRVQGVGFRPFVFQLAEAFHLKGTVQNNMDGVRITIEGEEEHIQAFLAAIQSGVPRLARIDTIDVENVPLKGYESFTIIPSEQQGASSLTLPVDASVCDDCLKEMYDESNRRYRYPFINCTQCGPRYTIIHSLPYDRPRTSMSSFSMCPDCQREYDDQSDRRHHAQPIACPSCGPKLSLYAMNGKSVPEQPLAHAVHLLQSGCIIAIKGIGGYHLACDATNERAIGMLRQRKNRPQKPLAIMVRSINDARTVCDITPREEELLRSAAAPIVLLNKRETELLAASLAPGMRTLGVMLPYAPLHHLLLEHMPYVVMTSANPSGLPMLYRDEEVYTYLDGIADYVLMHDRDIVHPIDDSVVQIVDEDVDIIRRARGYAPDPIVTNRSVHGVIGIGAQQKNTFAIGRHNQMFVGPHIGDMTHLEMLHHWKREYAHLSRWGGEDVRVAAVDMHPGFSTAELVPDDMHLAYVQHHHAHMVSCMEDAGITDSVFGIVLDGTGYGLGGNIWGFELLYGDAESFERQGHLSYIPLPGGEKSIQEPWRIAVSYLVHVYGICGIEAAKELFPAYKQHIPILYHIVEKRLNAPLAGTCGRLFDAVSALLGVCAVSTYEGEAAIKLSELARTSGRYEESYSYRMKRTDMIELDVLPMMEEIVADIFGKVDKAVIALKFHETLVRAITHMVKEATNTDMNKSVVLSGGSFHNPYLRKYVKSSLEESGYKVYTHTRIPCSDGGVSIGQVIAAGVRREEG